MSKNTFLSQGFNICYLNSCLGDKPLYMQPELQNQILFTRKSITGLKDKEL